MSSKGLEILFAISGNFLLISLMRRIHLRGRRGWKYQKEMFKKFPLSVLMEFVAITFVCIYSLEGLAEIQIFPFSLCDDGMFLLIVLLTIHISSIRRQLLSGAKVRLKG